MRFDLGLESVGIFILDRDRINDVQANHIGLLWYAIDENDADGAFEGELFVLVRVHGSVWR